MYWPRSWADAVWRKGWGCRMHAGHQSVPLGSVCEQISIGGVLSSNQPSSSQAIQTYQQKSDAQVATFSPWSGLDHACFHGHAEPGNLTQTSSRNTKTEPKPNEVVRRVTKQGSGLPRLGECLACPLRLFTGQLVLALTLPPVAFRTLVFFSSVYPLATDFLIT